MLQEVLYQVIQKKATEFPVAEGRGRYVAAAKDFRMPYWDWALVVPRGTNSFPSFFSSRTISIITPTSQGRPTPIDNPLYSFRFHPVNPVRGDFAGQVFTKICLREVLVAQKCTGRHLAANRSVAVEWHRRLTE